jgi:hypothetical protein
MNSPAWLQRATTWLAIAGYALLASGLPLPLGMLAPRGDAVADTHLAAKDRSRPFPCMDKPCGCATAEQCFTNCCCHTPAERLAWAKAHSVEPAVLVALERRIAADATPPEPAGGCCAAKAKRKPSCCSDRGVPPRSLADEPDVCADYQSLAAEPTGDDSEPVSLPTSPDEPTQSPPRMRTVTLQAMLACGGILTQWLAVGGSLPPLKVEAARPLPPLVDRIVLADDHPGSVLHAPDAPPPRA